MRTGDDRIHLLLTKEMWKLPFLILFYSNKDGGKYNI